MTANFTAGAVLTASNLNAAINTDTINAQTGAGYTLVLSDAGKTVTLSNASAQTLTIPTNATVAFATGTVIEVLNIGAGTWTVGGAGVTINGTTSIPNKGGVRLLKTGTDTWWAAAVDAAAGGGLAFITSSTFSGSSAVNVNNCFTSAYDNYRIVMTGTVSSTANIQVRMRLSGTDSVTGYSYGGTNISTSATAFEAGGSALTLGFIGRWVSGVENATTIDVFRPALAVGTDMLGYSASTARYDFFAYHSVATAYDGITLYPGAGTVTGSLVVLAYRKA